MNTPSWPRTRLSRAPIVAAVACLLAIHSATPAHSTQASEPMAAAHAELQLELHIEIPRLQVAEYHRPYVAIWLANEREQAVANFGVWYDVQLANREGEKWLKDIRQWWRRTGRTLSFPVDGVSGATRAPGTHRLQFTQFAADGTNLQQLPAGNYTLYIEAAREVGGRELLALPFQLPLQEAQQIEAQGSTELGLVQAHLRLQ